jgi:hypothetical protein
MVLNGGVMTDLRDHTSMSDIAAGDYVMVKVNSVTATTLIGDVVCKIQPKQFFQLSQKQPFFLPNSSAPRLYNSPL